jgi:hypothetical protein
MTKPRRKRSGMQMPRKGWPGPAVGGRVLRRDEPLVYLDCGSDRCASPRVGRVSVLGRSAFPDLRPIWPEVNPLLCAATSRPLTVPVDREGVQLATRCTIRAVCRHFGSGSDGTRTRDLRRDRPSPALACSFDGVRRGCGRECAIEAIKLFGAKFRAQVTVRGRELCVA